MQCDRLSERIGVEVRGLNLTAPLGQGDAVALRRAMGDHALLLFRQPALTVADQVRLVEVFAKVWDEKGDGTQHIYVSNAREGAVLGRPDGLLLHSDCVYMPSPLAVLSLYAMEVPASPSPTVFANNVTVVDDLPQDLRLRLADARGQFVGGLGGYERLRDGDAPAGARRVEHPVFYPDALAAQPPLIVDELYFDRFVGWDQGESDAVRSRIHALTYAERNMYVHHWAVGDLLIWDNVALQHGRRPVPEDGPRTLRRVVGLDPSVDDYEHLTGAALELEALRGR